MRGKLSFALLFSGLLSMYLFQDNSLYAKDTLEDGIIGLTKEEVREKFGKPPLSILRRGTIQTLCNSKTGK